MAAFAIKVEGPLEDEPDYAVASIRVGDFYEEFAISLGYWAPAEYQRHWREALTELVACAPTVALMTSMAPPKEVVNRRAWILYREGNRIFVQDHLLLICNAAPVFDELEHLRHISPRRTVDEDGYKISEWETDIGAVRNFLEGLG